MLNFHSITVGDFAVNCYFVVNPETRHALIFDPGDEFDRIQAFLQHEALTPLAALLTHAHVDHIGAVPQLLDTYSIPPGRSVRPMEPQKSVSPVSTRCSSGK